MDRRLAALALLAAASLSRAASATEGWDGRDPPGGLRKALAEGTAAAGGREVPATLRIQCHPAQDGALCIALKIEDSATLAGFAFDAFEGPDAPARGQRLLDARIGSGDGAVSVGASVEGRIAEDPATAFVLELCGGNRGASDAASLAQAIASGAGDVEILVRQPAGGGELRARFPGDREGGAVSRALRGCWKAE
jgi:hypothetical protein